MTELHEKVVWYMYTYTSKVKNGYMNKGKCRYSLQGWYSLWLKSGEKNQLRLVVSPIIYRVSYIPGGAGFQPSTVSQGFMVLVSTPF